MSFLKQVSRVYRRAMVFPVYDSSRIVLISDCHRGDGSSADDFAQNEGIYLYALHYYDEEQYTCIEIGDGDELWENKKSEDIINAHRDVFRLMKKLYDEGRLYFIYGNHDLVKRNPKRGKADFEQYYDRKEKRKIDLFSGVDFHEGIVLEYQNGGADNSGGERKNRILLIHGHQVDFMNSRLWRLSRFLVRYFWRPLELFGISNPTSPAQNQEKNESVGKRLTAWVLRERHMLIAGHTHRPMFPEPGEAPYFNDGSWIHPRLITSIELEEGSIRLVKWGILTKKDGTQFIGREVIDGPQKLQDYFQSMEGSQRILTALSSKDYDETGRIFTES